MIDGKRVYQETVPAGDARFLRRDKP